MSDIEIWFDFGSPYSHLSVNRIAAERPWNSVNVIWKPFLLGPIFKSFGWETSPFSLQQAKGDYMWRDMARQCRKYGVPWRRPSVFPRRALLPTRVALIGAAQPWMPSFCKEIMRLNFGCDQEVDRADVVTAALKKVGAPAAEVIVAAQSEQNKASLREQTDLARSRGIFGAPTFFAGEAMFWGNDRLDDALACARLGVDG
ncbi:MAG TPA: 2-hydroxychromene-2-carboxylate isomerase [Burkholderiales bacterium]|nr:2-hydroxychromene-2-carboxylate isomerase [Burkholderiales bacterium]